MCPNDTDYGFINAKGDNNDDTDGGDGGGVDNDVPDLTARTRAGYGRSVRGKSTKRYIRGKHTKRNADPGTVPLSISSDSSNKKDLVDRSGNLRSITDDNRTRQIIRPIRGPRSAVRLHSRSFVRGSNKRSEKRSPDPTVRGPRSAEPVPVNRGVNSKRSPDPAVRGSNEKRSPDPTVRGPRSAEPREESRFMLNEPSNQQFGEVATEMSQHGVISPRHDTLTRSIWTNGLIEVI